MIRTHDNLQKKSLQHRLADKEIFYAIRGPCKIVMKLSKYLRCTAKFILTAAGAFWFVFALLSGAGSYGGGVRGIIMNSPNALPWVVFLGVIYVAWRWELVGGALVAGTGLFTVFAFDTLRSPPVFFLLSFPLAVLGGCLIAGRYLMIK